MREIVRRQLASPSVGALVLGIDDEIARKPNRAQGVDRRLAQVISQGMVAADPSPRPPVDLVALERKVRDRVLKEARRHRAAERSRGK